MFKNSFLLLGDVHLPEQRDARGIDHKDDAISPAVANHLAPPKLQQVLRAASSHLSNHTDCAILLCGDLSSRGALDDYSACVQHLVDSLDLSSKPSSYLHVVPGNHDIDRRLCSDRDNLNLDAKFHPLESAWSESGIEAMSPHNVRGTEVVSNGCSASFYSLNTCIGCGEWRMLPESIRSEIGSAIDEYTNNSSEVEAFKLHGEQLDTPMVKGTHVTDLNESIVALAPDCLPVVLAHHNILPQATPRIALYTELINSGSLRTTLSKIGRPVIYCHGHIHDDPIEVISDATVSGSKLISISAPLLVDGFNVIDVHYTRSRSPIGVTVREMRLTPGGSVNETGQHRLPLCDKGIVGSCATELLRLTEVMGNDSLYANALRDRYNEGQASRVRKETIAAFVHEAEWRGLLTVIDRDANFDRWRVRRSAP